ncbi:hypothetical protein CYMTET_40249 [Cymbomonas tetramitiformis]|uniref:Uncharacterized protein n=1 Tax=Cymbomonas tetramitiformis TaxID=36881 RepID=A0AAE0C9P2_9CHLO|nr:hypothetical protein CYMTET_40249 [Cymbomonas tetramitiformis]
MERLGWGFSAGKGSQQGGAKFGVKQETVDETSTLPLAMLVISTSSKGTPAAAAIFSVNSARKDALKDGELNEEISRVEKERVRLTPSTFTIPGGGEGGGGGDGGGGLGEVEGRVEAEVAEAAEAAGGWRWWAWRWWRRRRRR